MALLRIFFSLYLVGPGQVGVVLSEDEERHHRHPVEDPDGEAEEVDQALDGAEEDHAASKNSLKSPAALTQRTAKAVSLIFH